jgi:hypothetical protein
LNSQQQKKQDKLGNSSTSSIFSPGLRHILFIGVLLIRCMDKKCSVSEHWGLACKR